jgi:hypothetical protein
MILLIGLNCGILIVLILIYTVLNGGSMGIVVMNQPSVSVNNLPNTGDGIAVYVEGTAP